MPRSSPEHVLSGPSSITTLVLLFFLLALLFFFCAVTAVFAQPRIYLADIRGDIPLLLRSRRVRGFGGWKRYNFVRVQYDVCRLQSRFMRLVETHCHALWCSQVIFRGASARSGAGVDWKPVCEGGEESGEGDGELHCRWGWRKVVSFGVFLRSASF
jgi:hypothetical protein